MHKELLSLALQSPPAVALDAADHLLAEGEGSMPFWCISWIFLCLACAHPLPAWCERMGTHSRELMQCRQLPSWRIPGNAEGAALLYRRGGKAARALEVADAAGLFGLVDDIAGCMGGDGEDAGLQARWVLGMGQGA